MIETSGSRRVVVTLEVADSVDEKRLRSLAWEVHNALVDVGNDVVEFEAIFVSGLGILDKDFA